MARSRDGPVIGLPPARTCPALGGVRPASSRSRVVLPQPDGPTIVSNSPSATERSMRSRTRCVPNDMLSARASNASGAVLTFAPDFAASVMDRSMLRRDHLVDLRLLMDQPNLLADIAEE